MADIDKTNVTLEEDLNERFDKLFNMFLNENWPQLRLYNRVIFILNSLSKVIDQDSIKFDKINEFLYRKPRPKSDYNINLPKITKVDDLFEFKSRLEYLQITNSDYYKSTCKKCGKEFYLRYGEMCFYLNNDLHLPKRCPDCIAESKKLLTTTE